MDYAAHFSTKKTPQSEAIVGRESDMTKNAAGGFAFKTDVWTNLNRFLILGAEGGTFYVGERQLVRENAQNVIKAIEENGTAVVDRIVEVSQKGLAVRNDPALFALAMCSKLGDAETRKRAFENLHKVARIPTHLFHFAGFIEAFGGWGRSTRRAFNNWYTQKTPSKLAFLGTKYQARDGWSHRDILRLTHIKPPTDEYSEIFKYMCGKENVKLDTDTEAFAYLRAVEQAKRSEGKDLLGLVKEFKLPMEVIPTDKRSKEVYELMLGNYGITALIRNLNNLTRSGVLANGAWDNNKKVIDRLTNLEQLKKGRVHPIQLLTAYKIYSQGHGLKGKSTWTPISDIKDALNDAFYLSFDAIQPTGLRWCLALDVSGSMSMANIANMPLTAREASGAMLMTRYRTEEKVAPIAFTSGMSGAFSQPNPQLRSRGWGHDNGVVNLKGFTRKSSLEQVYQAISSLPFGGTDCALPMLWAAHNKIEIDVFVVYTDNDSWAGDVHPTQALEQYRQKMGIDAKMIVCAMTASSYSVADPKDPRQMDVVGFSTDVPSVINNFAKGDL